jgi:hypothetical protein
MIEVPSIDWKPLIQDITNIITSNSFQTILTIILPSIVAIWIYLKQRNKKEINYEVISDASVISIDHNIVKQVEIKLNGNIVKEVTFAVLKVKNVGNIAVKKDDYEDPLVFVFKNRKVISCEIIETEPKDLIDDAIRQTFIPIPTSTQEYIEFPNFSLNPKESITFSVLLDGAKDIINKKGRILDGNIRPTEAIKNHNKIFEFIDNIANLITSIIFSIIFITGIIILCIISIFLLTTPLPFNLLGLLIILSIMIGLVHFAKKMWTNKKLQKVSIKKKSPKH